MVFELTYFLSSDLSREKFSIMAMSWLPIILHESYCKLLSFHKYVMSCMWTLVACLFS